MEDITHFTNKYRSIFLSDLYLGTKHSRVEEVITFLKNNECEYLYLVGDIIDGWSLDKHSVSCCKALDGQVNVNSPIVRLKLWQAPIPLG